MVYDVPLLQSLHQQLSDRHILKEVCQYNHTINKIRNHKTNNIKIQVREGHSKEGETLGDYCDGSLFKEHPLFSVEPRALQIILFFDDAELCNPLGTSAKVHKIGMIMV